MSRTFALTAKYLIFLFTIVVIPLGMAQEAGTQQILFTNVSVFDGKSAKLTSNQNVLVENNLIKTISENRIDAPGATVVDASGYTMTPGLIDMHQHLMLGGPDGLPSTGESIDFATAGAIGAQNMYEHLLMKGVTTVRDIGGGSLGLAKGVRMGWIEGPRIYSSGPPLGPIGGHGDVGGWNQHSSEDESVLMGNLATTSTVDQVIIQSRKNFRQGAAFLKVMPGGGVSTEFDPLEVVSMTLEEMKAAVAIAEDNKTYVAAHAYRDDAVNRAIDAGVKVIEHNFLVSEETIKRMAKEKVILSLQGFMAAVVFSKPEDITWYTPEQVRKAKLVHKGALQMVKWARKHDILIVSGSDMFGDLWAISKKNITIESEMLGFTPVEALRHATGNAGVVLAMSGPARSPYREGPLGVIKEGAYADILLWADDPTQNIKVIEDEQKLSFIMKDGEIYKNIIVPHDDPAYKPAPAGRPIRE